MIISQGRMPNIPIVSAFDLWGFLTYVTVTAYVKIVTADNRHFPDQTNDW